MSEEDKEKKRIHGQIQKNFIPTMFSRKKEK